MTTEQTLQEILTAVFNDIIEGLARFGCGMVGLPYPEDYKDTP